MVGGRAQPVTSLFDGQVGDDDADPAGCGEALSEPARAVVVDGLPVGHDDERGSGRCGELTHGGEEVLGAEPGLEGLFGGALDDRAVHEGVAVRQADLDHVGGCREQVQGVEALVERRVAGGEVRGEGGPALSAGVGQGLIQAGCRCTGC